MSRAQVRVQHFSVMMSLTLGVVYVMLFASAGMWVAFGALSLGIIANVVGLLGLTRRGRLRAGGTVISCGMALSFAVGVISRGGIDSETAAWMLLIPPLATTIVSRRLGGIMTIMTAIFYVGLWGAERLIDIPSPLTMPMAQLMLVVDYGAIAMMIGGLFWVQMGAWEKTNQELSNEIEIRQRAEARAHNAAQVRETFLATMSHEIRTPLNGILGLTEELMRIGLDEEPHMLAQTVHRSGEHLRALLNDVLDFSKLDAGTIALTLQPVSIRGLCTELIHAWRPVAQGRGLSLELLVEAGLPEEICTDPVRLRQILSNLLSNAIKFTQCGHVRLRAARQKDMLAVAVEDSGAGIQADQLDEIFKPFRQADNSTTRRYGGTGLGLAISRKLAEAMEGSLSVVSAPGEGATFTLRLPLSEPPLLEGALPAANTVSSTALDGLRILVVEDNAVNRLVLCRLLERHGATALIAEDGAIGVEVWAAQRPDLILMDCHMPNCDGYTATAQIRAAGGRLPIYAVTANTAPSDRERSLHAGMNRHLGKPVDGPALIRAIHQELAEGTERSKANRVMRPENPASRTGHG
ncbi:MAG: ATP-binding protein [Myxococcota bacterium]